MNKSSHNCNIISHFPNHIFPLLNRKNRLANETNIYKYTYMLKEVKNILTFHMMMFVGMVVPRPWRISSL
jgi:hypothetical protein